MNERIAGLRPELHGRLLRSQLKDTPGATSAPSPGWAGAPRLVPATPVSVHLPQSGNLLLCPSCQAGSLLLQEVVPGCDPSARPCAPSSPPSACGPGGQDGTFARTGSASQRLASRLRLSGHPRCPRVPRGTTGPGEVFSQMRQVGLTSRGALLPPEPGIHLRRSSGWWGLRESGQGLPWEMASLTKQDIQEERVPLMDQILSPLEGTQELRPPPSARAGSGPERADGEQDPGALRGPWRLSPTVRLGPTRARACSAASGVHPRPPSRPALGS